MAGKSENSANLVGIRNEGLEVETRIPVSTKHDLALSSTLFSFSCPCVQEENLDISHSLIFYTISHIILPYRQPSSVRIQQQHMTAVMHAIAAIKLS